MQKDGRILYLTEAIDENQYWNIPIANNTCLLLGTGTSITQAAMRMLAQDGVKLQRYLLSPLSKPILSRGEGSYFVETALICSSYIFATKMLSDLNRRIPSMLKLINQAKRINSKWIHKTVKRTGAFDKNDLCPCASGFSIKSCITKSGRLELVK